MRQFGIVSNKSVNCNSETAWKRNWQSWAIISRMCYLNIVNWWLVISRMHDLDRELVADHEALLAAWRGCCASGTAAAAGEGHRS